MESIKECKEKLTQTEIWEQLQNHYTFLARHNLKDLFVTDKKRFLHYSLECCGLFVDYSKNFVVNQTFDLLIKLADQQMLGDKIEKLFNHQVVNCSENKAALHTALRMNEHDTENTAQSETYKNIFTTRQRMSQLVADIHSQGQRGFSDQPFTDVIHIGIGGSEIGPRLVYEALQPLRKLNVHFLSTIDKAWIQQKLQSLNPETALVVVASKSFDTMETLVNLKQVREWIVAKAKDRKKINSQFFAITSHPDKAAQHGISAQNIFHIPNEVGGRYSVWSGVGLSLAMAYGMKHFNDLLAGARAMDVHFQTQCFEKNLPVVLSLLEVWYNNFFSTQQKAVVPYGMLLKSLPEYLQQLYMESLGKCVTQEGQPLDYSSGMSVWGGYGTSSQHTFHQWLLQGTRFLTVDFILPVKNSESDDVNKHLITNCLAQSQILMEGYSFDDVVQEQNSNTDARLLAHQLFPGNRPSNIILIQQLTPFNVGSLLALYEHIVYVQSVIWNINAFDQWAVERGKKLSENLRNNLTRCEMLSSHNPTTALIKKLNEWVG